MLLIQIWKAHKSMPHKLLKGARAIPANPTGRNHEEMSAAAAERVAALAQGASYVGFCGWAFLRRRHYVAVHQLDGTSTWVLNAHAGWMGLVGGLMAAAGLRGEVPATIRLLGLGSAMGLAANDALLRDRIAPIYRRDLQWETTLAMTWLLTRLMRRSSRRRTADRTLR